MNKKGYIQLTIPIIIAFLFEIFVTGLIFDAIEPSLEEILMDLNDDLLCPPELQDNSYEICIGKSGEIFVDGTIKKAINLEYDSGGIPCTIKEGIYSQEKICIMNDLWKADKIYVKGIGFFNMKKIRVSKLLSYTQAGKYIKILRIVKKIPKI